MDLCAHVISQDEMIMSYINKHYGGVPRLRGVRFMKIETPYDSDGYLDYQEEAFNSYCGKDVIYIHTRCGGKKNWEDSNYVYFGADKWEDSNPLFLEGVTDEWDATYRDHYFEAVVDDEYNKLINMLAEGDE